MGALPGYALLVFVTPAAAVSDVWARLSRGASAVVVRRQVAEPDVGHADAPLRVT